MIMLIKEVICPRCKSPEEKSATELNIRAFKVCDKQGQWWSECLVCEEAGRKAWFAS